MLRLLCMKVRAKIICPGEVQKPKETALGDNRRLVWDCTCSRRFLMCLATSLSTRKSRSDVFFCGMHPAHTIVGIEDIYSSLAFLFVPGKLWPDSWFSLAKLRVCIARLSSGLYTGINHISPRHVLTEA